MSFASDVFTGTELASLNGRAADQGGTWTVRAGSMAIHNNATTVTDYSLATLSVTPASADYDVSVDITVAADTAPGVVGRASPTDLDYYYFRYLKDTSEFQLYKFQGGGATNLGSFFQVLTLGSTVRLTLRLRGSTISGLADGVERVSVTDTTYTTAGVVGIRNGGSGSLATFDNFDASLPAQAGGRRSSVIMPRDAGVISRRISGLSLPI